MNAPYNNNDDDDNTFLVMDRINYSNLRSVIPSIILFGQIKKKLLSFVKIYMEFDSWNFVQSFPPT